MSREHEVTKNILRAVECVILCGMASLLLWWVVVCVALFRLVKDARYEMVCVALVLDALYGPFALLEATSFTFVFFCVGVVVYLVRGRLRIASMQNIY